MKIASAGTVRRSLPRHSLAPAPSACVKFRPSDRLGLLHTAEVVSITCVGLTLSRLGGPAWIAGQALFAVALVQWFILLHECGHETLFRSASLNTVVGHIAAFFSGIPFLSWRRIHAKHHRWTGWQDLDPTTASLVPRGLSAFERFLINVSWKYWIPTFSVLYRANNYWNLARLRALIRTECHWRRVACNAGLLLAAYGIIVAVLGFSRTVEMAGLAVILAFVVEDPLILSQHTHIPQQLSGGDDVRPFPALEQEAFTRSLQFPAWCSKFVLFNFDAHELHHMYPFVPGYYLRRIAYTSANEVDWWKWIIVVKRIPGEQFLFQNQNDSGIRI